MFKLNLGLLALSLVSVTSAHASDSHKTPHWSYEGEAGPENWGELAHDYHLCREGNEQSPIDLRWKKPQSGHEMKFDYQATGAKVVDNGHTVQVNFSPGSKLSLEGKDFDLLQMHFHTRSEHSLSKKHFPLEAHFVHKNAKGELAVVGVFFSIGKENPTLAKIWEAIPETQGKEKDLKLKGWSPDSLLPQARTHYHYKGSLTTPPCSEGVDWNVFNTPLEVSKKQLERFHQLYTNNARPVQSLHERRPANY